MSDYFAGYRPLRYMDVDIKFEQNQAIVIAKDRDDGSMVWQKTMPTIEAQKLVDDHRLCSANYNHGINIREIHVIDG